MFSRRSAVPVVALGLTATLAATWPPLHLVLVHANLATYYQENIGWRFFWVQRFIEHVPGSYVHPGQGVLLPLLQALFYLFAKDVLGLDLYGQIDLFGHLTLSVGAAALIAVMLLIAIDRRLDPGVRAALVATPLVMGLADSNLFSYAVYPDYLAYTKVAFLGFGWRWLHHEGAEGNLDTRCIRELGILAGLTAALKLTYLVWPGGLFLVTLLVATRTYPFTAIGRTAVTMALVTAVTWAVFLFIFYYGDVFDVVEYFHSLFAWSAVLHSELTISLDPLTWGEASLAHLLVVLSMLCLLRLFPVGIKSLALVSVAVALAAGNIAMTYWRGGQTSNFDAVIMICVLCPVITGSFDKPAMTRLASLVVAALFFLWPAAWTFHHWQDYLSVKVSGHQPLTTLGEAGDWQRGLFNWNMSHGLPVYVLTPTNYEAQGTIEDMIYMGFQNFGGAPRGMVELRDLYPPIHFLYFETPTDPSYHLALPPERVVFMHIEGQPVPDFPHLDPKLYEDHDRQVERLVSNRRKEACYSVRQFLTHVNIVSCVLSAPQ